jgi:hypothetical protein
MLTLLEDSEILDNDCGLSVLTYGDDVVVEIDHPSGAELTLRIEARMLASETPLQVWEVRLRDRADPDAPDPDAPLYNKTAAYVRGSTLPLLVGAFCTTSTCSAGRFQRQRLVTLAHIHRAAGVDLEWANE